MKKIKITITSEDGLVGTTIKDGNKILDWNELDREEQVFILNTMASSYTLFHRFLKKEE